MSRIILYFLDVNQLNMASVSILLSQYTIEMRLTRRGANSRKATLDQVKDCNVYMFRPLPNFDSFSLIHTYIITYDMDI